MGPKFGLLPIRLNPDTLSFVNKPLISSLLLVSGLPSKFARPCQMLSITRLVVGRIRNGTF